MFNGVIKQIYTWFGRPYMKTTVKHNADGSTGIDAIFNQHFIRYLDISYGDAKNVAYNPMLEDNVKIAFYLADQLDSVLGRFEQSLNRNQLLDDEDDGYDDPLKGVPYLRDAPIRDQIDLANTSRMGIAS